jgi:penicillin-binding protein-related factor A (putative recombinase)
LTPEGTIKKKVTALLKQYKDMYYFMPVVSGYGKRTIDYLGCYKGKFFSIEAKAPKKEPTHLQNLTIQAIRNAGGKAFVINSEDGLLELHKWLEDEA